MNEYINNKTLEKHRETTIIGRLENKFFPLFNTRYHVLTSFTVYLAVLDDPFLVVLCHY